MKSKNEYKVEVGKAKFNESAMFVMEDVSYGTKELEVETPSEPKSDFEIANYIMYHTMLPRLAIFKIINAVKKRELLNNQDILDTVTQKILKMLSEERGSGYDKIIEATGKNELLAPRIENQNNQFTKAVLFAKVPFEMTTKEDRVRTCYMQACLAYVNYEAVSNGDIRKLFGLSDQEMTKASRLIQNTIDAGLIKAVDPETAPRYKKYIPYWA